MPWEKSNATKGDKLSSPAFWRSYNKIKHAGELEHATLENAISSMAALFALLLILYSTTDGESFFSKAAMPVIFDYPNLRGENLVTESSFNIEIP